MRTVWCLLSTLFLIVSTNCLPYTDIPSHYQIPTSIEEQVPEYEQQAGSFDYPNHFAENLPISNEGAFTLTCNGQNKLCVKKHLCQNGFVNPYHIGFAVPTSQLQQCDVNEEVCCTVAQYEIPAQESSQYEGTLEVGQKQEELEQEQLALEGEVQGAENLNQVAVKEEGQVEEIPESGAASGSVPLAVGTGAGSQFVTSAPPVQSGCAAALLCVDEKFCMLDGTISPEPVEFTSQQLLRRVPLSTCKNRDNGAIGRCCRDPNYVDPWPTGNLPANYSGGFDEQGFPTFLNIAKVKPPTVPPKFTPRPPVVQIPVQTVVTAAPPTVAEDSKDLPQFLFPPNEVAMNVNNLDDSTKDTTFVKIEQPEESDSHAVHVPVTCGVKNTVQRRPDVEESITGFAEIPWQAMVLHSEQRKILCSGALVSADSILTAANCVDSLSPNEVSIKLGEWKLGYELKHEEPLPFEILNVNSIDIHPGYKKGYSNHDLAILFLDRPATFDYHVNPLCLPDYENTASESRQCLTSGWGKSILQSHYAGAIMHAVNVDLLTKENCENRLLSTAYSNSLADDAICVKPTKERNNVCESDVGAPLACDNGNGVYELTGIYSQDNGCQATNQVAVFAPIDMTWVKATMTSLRPPINEHPGYEIPVPEFTIDDATNYRESNFTADNQYLPPN